MTTMYKGIAVCLLLCIYGQAEEQNSPGPQNWQALRGKGLEAGGPCDLIDQTLNACRKYGLSVEQADQLLDTIYTAQTEHLPGESICTRIEEGLAKNVAIEQVLEASLVRLEHLREAQALVSSIVEGSAVEHGDGPKKLVVNVSMALESGLSADMLKAALVRNGHKRLGRMAHAVEVGESLYLAGLEPAQVQRIMTDFLDRNVSRHEMIRAAEVLREGIANGQDFESVYDSLWVSAR